MRNILIASLGLVAGAIITASIVSTAAPLTKSVTYNVNLSAYQAKPGDAFEMRVDFARTLDGKSIGGRVIRVPVSGPVLDGDGNQVSASVPAAFTTARNAFESQIGSLLDSAASAGKLDP